jgi:ABC-type multidrug transport system ATPase subunit
MIQTNKHYHTFCNVVIIYTLQVSGRVTYNGHRMDEFMPERTSAYISQHDLHIPEMTVRETLAFSARCPGVGARFGMTQGNQLEAHALILLLLADSVFLPFSLLYC